MENLTLGTLADSIIVLCFFSFLGGAAGNALARFVCWIIDRVKKMRDRRGKDKTNGDEVEQ